MKVGDLVRHVGWKEVGIVVEEVDVGCALWGTPRDRDVFKVQVVNRNFCSHWVRRDVEVLSASR